MANSDSAHAVTLNIFILNFKFLDIEGILRKIDNSQLKVGVCVFVCSYIYDLPTILSNEQGRMKNQDLYRNKDDFGIL